MSCHLIWWDRYEYVTAQTSLILTHAAIDVGFAVFMIVVPLPFRTVNPGLLSPPVKEQYVHGILIN